jgi:hypothetical protein
MPDLVLVGTAATALTPVPAAGVSREEVVIVNQSGGGVVIYVGQSGVTASTGVPLAAGSRIGPLPNLAQLFAVTAGATSLPSAVPPALAAVTRLSAA